MWPWRRRPPIERLNLPTKVFISHSYKDAATCERLLALLPKSVEPFIFPPITVLPEQMVSNALITAILEHDGLIYLQGGASKQSFWVAFERDYALRSGKRVFGFDPQHESLELDRDSPLDLPIFAYYSRQDAQRVKQVTSYMKTERFFHLTEAEVDPAVPEEEWTLTLQKYFFPQIDLGGLGLLFVSAKSSESDWVQYVYTEMSRVFEGKILLAALDAIPNEALTRTPQSLLLYESDERSERQMLDDLIVQLYWLIYRNTHQNQLS
jgi:hypothetical protein